MKFKTGELNLHIASTAPDASIAEANDLNLYDDLHAFIELSPEEQKAAVNRTTPAESSQQSPVEIPETNPVQEQQKAFEPVKEPAREPQQANASNKDGSADFQLAEILRVTGHLADFSATHDLSSICEDCGSPASSEDLFCINCGGLLESTEPETPLLCGDCGETIADDEIFCPSCGSAMFGA